MFRWAEDATPRISTHEFPFPMADFYSIPFSFRALLHQQNDRLHVTVEESIRQGIGLIITTRMGELRFDEEYGCRIWDKDFVVISNQKGLEIDAIKQSLEEAIRKHEKRIESIENFNAKVVTEDTGGVRRIHQRLEIQLSGHLRGTNKQFEYSEVLYFSPVSLV